MPARPSALTRELVLLLVLATLWGASYSLIKVGVESIPPISLMAARTLGAGTLLFLLTRWRGVSLPRDRSTWRLFLVQACLNCVVPFTLIAWAQQTTDATLATILNSTTPIFTVTFAALYRCEERLSMLRLVGVCTGFIGICLIVGLQALEGLGQAVWSQLAIVVAAACYGGAAILGREFKAIDPILPATGSMLCGAAILVPASLVLEQPWLQTPSRQSLLALAALTVLSTALAFVIYFRLVRTLGSVGITAQAYLRVPVGVAIGVIFLGEQLSTGGWIGLACVIAGVAAMTAPTRERRIRKLPTTEVTQTRAASAVRDLGHGSKP